MNKVKILPDAWYPPFPETISLYKMIKYSNETFCGVVLHFDGDAEAIEQYRIVDVANGIKTDWSPPFQNKSFRKAIWWLWGQYYLQLRRNSRN